MDGPVLLQRGCAHIALAAAALASREPKRRATRVLADGTTGCSLEATRFQQALPAIEAAKAQLVGVSMDSLESHGQFCTDKALTFPLLSDKADGSVSASYGADLKIPILGRFSDRQARAAPARHSEPVLPGLASRTARPARARCSPLTHRRRRCRAAFHGGCPRTRPTHLCGGGGGGGGRRS